MEWNGLHIGKHPQVYEPSDDTFLLAETVQAVVPKGCRFVEVGCGAGVISLTAAKLGAHVECTDLNPFAVELTRHNAKENRLELTAYEGNLLEPIEAADWVAFNPPYLPTAEDEHVAGPLDLAFDGGPDGNRVALQFAAQVGRLKPAGVLVVHSSLSDPAPLDAAMATHGYACNVANEQKLPYEVLTVRRYE